MNDERLAFFAVLFYGVLCVVVVVLAVVLAPG